MRAVLCVVCLFVATVFLPGCTQVIVDKKAGGDVQVRYMTVLKEVNLDGLKFSKTEDSFSISAKKYQTNEGEGAIDAVNKALDLAATAAKKVP